MYFQIKSALLKSSDLCYLEIKENLKSKILSMNNIKRKTGLELRISFSYLEF